MQKTTRRLLALGIAGSLAVGVTACGSDDKSSTTSSDSGEAAAGTALAANKISGPAGVASGKFFKGVPTDDQQKGGKLQVLFAEQFQHLDPGAAYFQADYMVTSVVHRALYTYNPADSSKVLPDLASGPPEVAADGKTVTVKLQPNAKFGPPVSRTITSDDVKYAFERGLKPSVQNGYEAAYFGDLLGFKGAKGGDIPGIETPDKTTIVFKLSKPTGATVAKALVLPLSSPVPREYATKLDAKTPSTYDQDPTKQVASGPYMIKSYAAGRSATLVRNPSWDGKASGDPRPAYVDEIDIKLGGDSDVNSRQVLSGSNTLGGDPPSAEGVKRFVKEAPQQITFSALGNRYVALNTTKKPFNDLNVRKAAAAVLDRDAMRLQRGGPLIGEIATHFLFPGSPGFEQAGGEKGPGYDFLNYASGNLELAQSYLKKAGFKDGKYSGPAITMIADTESPGRETSEVVQNSFAKLGFKVSMRNVGHATMYEKYCQVVEAMKDVDACPNFGWLPDFVDGVPMFAPTFDGDYIQPVNMNNPSLFDDKKINAEITKGSQTVEAARRDAIFGQVDKDVTAQVPAIPWLWDTQANAQGKNVHGVVATWNSAWDFAYTSLVKP